MFSKIPQTPEDFVKATTEYFSFLPKNEKEFKAVAEKVKAVVEVESEKNKELIKTINKASRGDASTNELMGLTKRIQDSMTTARFAALMAVPGAVFALPAIVAYAKEYDMDLIPASVAKEFNL